MVQDVRIQNRRRRISLSIRVSLWLMVAALFPLIVLWGVSDLYSRPTLTSQATKAMESDASTRLQLIDTYLQERELDTQTLAQVPSVQTFLVTAPTSPTYQDQAVHASYSLVAGMFRDKHYTQWSLFDAQGNFRLSYPTTTRPQPHGQYLIPPEDAQKLKQAKAYFISEVYYHPETKKSSIDIYSPIYFSPLAGAGPVGKYVGCIRATLDIDYIQNIVNAEQGNNGAGSSAFMLDENGVYIASSDADLRFKAVAPLSSDAQTRIQNEQRYGANTQLTVQQDSMLVEKLHESTTQSDYQTALVGKAGTYQIVQRSSSLMPWKYFVLSPVSTVTEIANRQFLFTLSVALAMGVLAVLFGVIVGRRIAYPIRSSMRDLQDNSDALSSLAQRQQDAASEQMWVVDASQVGLKSIQYYTEATKVAAQKLTEIGSSLIQQWTMLDRERFMQALEQMMNAAQYIEHASDYQYNSNQKLATALKVATQVTEQLASGATSASEAATQLEQVVEQLRSVSGK